MQTLEPCLGDIQCSKGIRIKQYHQHFEELLPLEKTGIEYLQDEFNLSPPEKARATLGQFGLPGASHFTKIGSLSGGQKAAGVALSQRDPLRRRPAAWHASRGLEQLNQHKDIPPQQK